MTKWKNFGGRTRRLLPTQLTTTIQKMCVKNLSPQQVITYQLFMQWKTIVGPDFSAIFTPEKTSYNLTHKKQILHLKVSDTSHAFLFPYQKEELLTKINHYFGRDVFGDLKLDPKALKSSSSQRASDPKNTPTAPSLFENKVPKSVSNALTQVKDPLLQEKLKSLSQRFYEKE